jgi:hypothetical protein
VGARTVSVHSVGGTTLYDLDKDETKRKTPMGHRQCRPMRTALDYLYLVVPIANYCFTVMCTVQYIRIVRLYDGPTAVGCWLELFAATDREPFDPVTWCLVLVYRCPRYERGSCAYDASSDMFSLRSRRIS